VREELRPVLDGVRAERRPGDATWVAGGARFAFRFYVPDPDPRVEFEVPLRDAAALRRSLAALAAQGEGRVWAIFSHRVLADEVRVIGALGRLRIERRITAPGAGALLLVAPDAAAGGCAARGIHS